MAKLVMACFRVVIIKFQLLSLNHVNHYFVFETHALAFLVLPSVTDFQNLTFWLIPHCIMYWTHDLRTSFQLFMVYTLLVFSPQKEAESSLIMKKIHFVQVFGKSLGAGTHLQMKPVWMSVLLPYHIFSLLGSLVVVSPPGKRNLSFFLNHVLVHLICCIHSLPFLIKPLLHAQLIFHVMWFQVRGDIARALMYMAVGYGFHQPGGGPGLRLSDSPSISRSKIF